MDTTTFDTVGSSSTPLNYYHHGVLLEDNATSEVNSTAMGHEDNTSHSIMDIFSGRSVASNAAQLQLTRLIVQKIFVPTIVTVGVVGNLVSIVVLTRRLMKSSTNCYLTALAIFDCLYLLCSFTLSFLHYPDIRDTDAYTYWFLYGRVFTDIFSNTSVWLTVTFTVERFIGVRYPMKGRIICTPKRANFIITVVCLLALSCTMPEFFEARIISVTDGNDTYLDIEDTELALTFSYQIGYYWFYVTIFTLLPLVGLCAFNGILIYSVYQATKIRKAITNVAMSKSENRHQSEQTRITLMLISIVIVFLMCQIPGATLHLYRTVLQVNETIITKEKNNELKMTGNVTNTLVQLNAAVNIFLYSVFSTRFRRTFKRVFCSCIPGYDAHSHVTDTSVLYHYSRKGSGGASRKSTVRWSLSNDGNDSNNCSIRRKEDKSLLLSMFRLGIHKNNNRVSRDDAKHLVETVPLQEGTIGNDKGEIVNSSNCL